MIDQEQQEQQEEQLSYCDFYNNFVGKELFPVLLPPID
jgi:hypothetical protein